MSTTINPVVHYRDLAAGSRFLVDAFGFVQHQAHQAEDGSTQYVELSLNGAPLGLGPHAAGSMFDTGPSVVYISLDEIVLSDGTGKLRNISIDDIHLWRPEPSVGLLPGAPPALPALVPFATKQNLRIGSPEYFTALRGKHPEKKVVEQSALKEGYIEAGQTISGYVYFEPVSGEDGKVHLEVKVRSGAQSGVLTETEIPFAVEE